MHSKSLAALGIISMLALGCSGLTIDGEAPVDCTAMGAGSIVPVSGKHAASTCGGIQGDIWTSTDGHSTMTARYTSSGVCVDGQIAAVVAQNYTAYWGAAVGVNLNQPSKQAASAYDAKENGVEGFGFSVSGSALPPSTRLRAQLLDTDNKNFCKSGIPGYPTSLVLLSDFKQDCFATTPGNAPNSAHLSSIAVTITAVDAAPLSYSMCVDFSALLESGG